MMIIVTLPFPLALDWTYIRFNISVKECLLRVTKFSIQVHEDLAWDLCEILHGYVKQGDALTGGEGGQLGHQPPHLWRGTV